MAASRTPFSSRLVSRRTVGGLAAATAGVIALALPAVAHASPGGGQYGGGTLHVVRTIASDYVGPLQFAIDGQKIYVADSFTANLYQVGRTAPLVHNSDPAGSSPEQSPDIAGVGVDPRTGVVAFTKTNADHSDTRLVLRYPDGVRRRLATLSTYEKNRNPDQVNHYGVDHPSACVRAALDKAGVPVDYTGEVDSHPYAVVALGNGAWAVADAGGNDVVRVDRWGHVSTLAVLPPAPVKITSAIAASLGLPSCVVGVTYKFEPVPTDVELGPAGTLLVSTLASGPGGDPTPVATGSVWAIGYGQRPVKLAGGFSNATNIAYDGRRTIYVAELGAGRITAISPGHRAVVATLPNVVGVEWSCGHLYASTAPAANGADGPGTIVELG